MDLIKSLSGGDKDTLTELMREAEVYLDSQLKTALAADQRAFGLARAWVNVVVAATGGGIWLNMNAESLWLQAAAFVVSLGLIIATLLVNFSGLPRSFEFAGNTPSSWVRDIVEKRSTTEMLAEQLAHYDKMISDNATLMKCNANLVRRAVFVAWLAVAIGGVTTAGVILHDVVVSSAALKEIPSEGTRPPANCGAPCA